MRKISLLISFLLFTCSLSFAKTVAIETAQLTGYNYLVQHKSSGIAIGVNDLKLAYSSTTGSSEIGFYVFNLTHGFVMVSADDAVNPILGYSNEGVFKADKLPSNFLNWVDNYNKQIDFVKTNNIPATPQIAQKWSDLVNNTTPKTAGKTTLVTPLLTTIWNQSPYYNDDCPYDASAGSLSVTGCVATATAQVMKFWNWPAHGVGLHSYSTSSFGTLSADFGSTTYNWSAMPNEVTAANPAVATLMYQVGVAVEMNYSGTESSAYVIIPGCPITNNAEYALKTYFNYDPALHGLQRTSYTDATWISMLEAELDGGRPIIYDGHGTAGGHCFVFDGYDVSNNFHVNWGWDGTDNGYFAIDALNPSVLGTGGGAGGFNSGQEAIFGVKPNTTSTTTTSSLALYDYVNLTASSINYGAAFTVSTNIQNTGTTTFGGDFCAAAFDYTSGTFITFIDSVTGLSLPAGSAFTTSLSFPTTGLLAMLPGMYQIGIFYRPTGGSWVAVSNSGSYTNFVAMTVVNSAPMELSTAMAPSPLPLVEGTSASVTLNIQNYGTVDFSGSYDVSLYNLDGTYNSTIQTMSGMTLPAGTTYSTPLVFSTTSITATPGTYLLALQYNDGTAWYLGGADYFTNPIFVTVVAPPLLPDIYEVNNTAATAYSLPLTFVSDVATANTTGSNFHITTDQDYYKIVLASGYNYYITARVNDIVSHDDAGPYTVNAVWSYSLDGGSTWSAVYDDVMPGSIILGGLAGGTVTFHCSPAFAGNLGTYELKLGSITRTTSSAGVPNIDLSAAKIYPNPATNLINIDLANIGTNGNAVTVTDIQGRSLFTTGITNNTLQIPLDNFASGMYFIEIATESGIIRNKFIVVNKN